MIIRASIQANAGSAFQPILFPRSGLLTAVTFCWQTAITADNQYSWCAIAPSRTLPPVFTGLAQYEDCWAFCSVGQLFTWTAGTSRNAGNYQVLLSVPVLQGQTVYASQLATAAMVAYFELLLQVNT